MPADLCYPFSALELLAYRILRHVGALVAAAAASSPRDRAVRVTRWYLTAMSRENLEKKGFNPVLGETHEAHVTTEQGERVEFKAEQVSHHPPVTCFSLRSPSLDVVGSLFARVTFTGNAAAIRTFGRLRIRLVAVDEVYVIDRPLADIGLHHLLFPPTPGTKRFAWEGVAAVRCARTRALGLVRFFEGPPADDDTDTLDAAEAADVAALAAATSSPSTLLPSWFSTPVKITNRYEAVVAVAPTTTTGDDSSDFIGDDDVSTIARETMLVADAADSEYDGESATARVAAAPALLERLADADSESVRLVGVCGARPLVVTTKRVEDVSTTTTTSSKGVKTGGSSSSRSKKKQQQSSSSSSVIHRYRLSSVGAELRLVYSKSPPPTDSLVIWKSVAEAIVDDDMPTANAAKIIVEKEQRRVRSELAATGAEHKPLFFRKDESGQWMRRQEEKEIEVEQSSSSSSSSSTPSDDIRSSTPSDDIRSDVESDSDSTATSKKSRRRRKK